MPLTTVLAQHRTRAAGRPGGVLVLRLLFWLVPCLVTRLVTRLVPCLVLSLSLAAAPAWAIKDDWQGVERIVAVGDVHGDYDNYIKVLEQAEVINRRGRWIAGNTHLVQLGDVPDRGPSTDKIIAHLMKLENQAEKAGGRVHALFGNHEAMNILGDLRYVHPGEYEALTSRRSQSLLDKYYKRVVDYLSAQPDGPVIDEAFRENWLKQHPPGYVEHRQYWHPEGEFGEWVTGHNGLVRINRTLFVHGGIGPAQLAFTISAINEQLRDELRNPTRPESKLVDTEDGPLWYRGLSQAETLASAEHLERVLAHFDVDRIVVGHTPGFATVVPRFDARVLVADSGIADYYGGYLASLLIEGDALYTIQRGQRVPIPKSDAGLLEYYRAIAEIEPDANNLKVMIKRLENGEAAGIPEESDPHTHDG